MDSGYELTRLAFVLADLPVVVTGRPRSDRVMIGPIPARRPYSRQERAPARSRVRGPRVVVQSGHDD